MSTRELGNKVSSYFSCKLQHMHLVLKLHVFCSNFWHFSLSRALYYVQYCLSFSKDKTYHYTSAVFFLASSKEVICIDFFKLINFFSRYTYSKTIISPSCLGNTVSTTGGQIRSCVHGVLKVCRVQMAK